MELTDRLQLVMKLNNLSSSAFADEIGVQRSSISHLLSGRNKPSLDFIQKTLARFPNVNAEWLITGKQGGAKSSTGSSSNSTTPDSSIAQNNKSLPDKSPKASNDHSGIDQREVKKIKKILVFYTDNTFEEYIRSETGS